MSLVKPECHDNVSGLYRFKIQSYIGHGGVMSHVGPDVGPGGYRYIDQSKTWR